MRTTNRPRPSPRRFKDDWRNHIPTQACEVCGQTIPPEKTRNAADYERRRTCGGACRRRLGGITHQCRQMPAGWLPTPDEIAAECELIKAENLKALRDGERIVCNARHNKVRTCS